jgi:hypothetical protein
MMMATDTTDLYAANLEAALTVLRTELAVREAFLLAARSASAHGDEARAARNRATAAAAVDGARRIAARRANFLRRLAAHRADWGDDVGATKLEEQAVAIEHLVEERIGAVTDK